MLNQPRDVQCVACDVVPTRGVWTDALLLRVQCDHSCFCPSGQGATSYFDFDQSTSRGVCSSCSNKWYNSGNSPVCLVKTLKCDAGVGGEHHTARARVHPAVHF